VLKISPVRDFPIRVHVRVTPKHFVASSFAIMIESMLNRFCMTTAI